MLLRGMTRMMVSALVLCISAWVAFRVWQAMPSISLQWTGKSESWLTLGLPLGSFLLSFLVSRKLLRIITNPFGKNSSDSPPQPHSLISTIFRLFLSIIPTALICLIGATFLHHSGSVADLRAYSRKAMGDTNTKSTSFVQALKSSIEDTVPASWLAFLDPSADSARITLAKLITAQSDSPPTAVIDPQTGKPIPRAIIVNDPELQNLARQGNFSTLLRHPLLTQALEDPKLQKLLKNLSL